jgi:RNA polymerase sigma factor (TIGR02999 family)
LPGDERAAGSVVLINIDSCEYEKDYSIFVEPGVWFWGGTPRGLLGGDKSQDITELLEAWGEGDQTAFERLVPQVYAELKRMARRHMYRESEGHLLQTTALVHEAYLKLVSQKGARWQNRAHFFAVSSQQMRRILVDAARSRLRQKRGSDAPVVSLDDAPALSVTRAAEFVALDDALRQLAQLDPRRSRVVEMRYFGGMSVEETAAALNLSADTVMRDWKAAKAWLFSELDRSGNCGKMDLFS